MSDQNQNQQDQNAEGGLFSDEYEAPKQENPYLKKNREKARKQTRTDSRVPSPPEPEPEGEEQEKPPVPDGDGKGYTHKRTFSDWFFEHVKLIAAIATVLVVLSLVLITDVVGVVEDLIHQSQQADRQELTMSYVKGLSEKTTPITWADLEDYRRDETRAEGSVTWMFEVKDTDYEVWISGVGTSLPPTYVYLYDMKTGDRMVLGAEDLDAFIAAHP